MLPDRVSNPGPLTYESGALPIALRGPARTDMNKTKSLRLRRGIIKINEAQAQSINIPTYVYKYEYR